MLDIKITGGRVFDGTGREASSGDIGIQGDRIAGIGDLSRAEARNTIRADGRIVCPGFIDTHSHSDMYCFLRPSADSKIFQGVTTEVVGNCGASAAPLYPGAHTSTDWQSYNYPFEWKSVREYRERVDQIRPAVNIAMLVGHNTLRTGLAGYENRPLNADERREIVRRMEEALDEGARGMSTGLIYAPGMFATKDEITDLAKAVGRRDGVYASHMRSEGARLLEAIREISDVARESGCRTQISHLKTSHKENWHLIDDALGLIKQARADGLRLAADRYPYTSGWTSLDVVLPNWAHEGGRPATMARLHDPATRKKLRDAIVESRPPDAWNGIVIGATAHPGNARFRGERLTEAAAALKMDPVDAILHFAETDELKTGAFFFGMSEENMLRILAQDYVMIGSDSSIRAPEGVLSEDYPHPRAYGTFPLFLRWALDGRTVALPEAIRKMTSLPATHFNLRERGMLADGMKADAVVFDPATIRDKSTYAKPHQLSEGIVHVVVNGVPTVADGKLTGVRAGRFL